MSNKKIVFTLVLLVLAVIVVCISSLSVVLAVDATPDVILAADDELRVTFFDVGNGDCVFVKFGNIEILVDTGEKERYVERLYNIIKNSCEDKVLEYVISTHGDKDHIGLMKHVYDFFNPKLAVDSANSRYYLEGYSIKNIIDFDSQYASGLYAQGEYQNYVSSRKSLISSVESSSINYKSIADWWDNANDTQAKSIEIVNDAGEEMTIHLLYNELYFKMGAEEDASNLSAVKNAMSICLLLQYGDSKVLLTGDLDEAKCHGESKLLENNAELLEDVTVYKAAHHGSEGSNSDGLLKVIRPKYSVVSCEAGGQYNFPSQLALNNLFKYSGEVYITSKHDVAGWSPYYGDVSISMDIYGDTAVEFSNKAMDGISLQDDTKWFKLNRTVPTSIIEISPDDLDNGNCTLIKTGNKELLMNAGLYKKNSSRCFVDELKKYCRDGVLEYVVVSNARIDNISQFSSTTYTDDNGNVVSNRDGIFDSFKVEHLIDFGSKTNLSESNTVIYKTYKESLRNATGINYTPASECINSTFSLYDADNPSYDVSFEILKTQAYAQNFKITDEANYSIAVMVYVGEYKALFTGDLNNNDGSETYLVKENKDSFGDGVDYYKMSAHGYYLSNSSDIINSLTKDATVVVNCIMGTNYSGVSSDKCSFPSDATLKEISNKTKNIYATMHFEYDGYVDMYGTVRVDIDYSKSGELNVSADWENRNTERYYLYSKIT